MIVIVIILLLLFSLLVGLIYVTLRIGTVAFLKLTNNDSTHSKLKRKNILLVTSILVAGAMTYFFLFTSPASIYETAYIEKQGQRFIVTVKGKRVYMVHDPISAFLRKTYEEREQFIIPRSEGTIKAEEISVKQGLYKWDGEITIRRQNMKINLYVDNYDDKKVEPNGWNGNYKLVWRQQ